MAQWEETPDSSFLLEDGEAPRTHAEVSLEDFIKAPRRPTGRFGRHRRSQSNLKIDANAPALVSNTLPEARQTPTIARRNAPPPEFVPSSATHPPPATPLQARSVQRAPPALTDPQPFRNLQHIETPPVFPNESFSAPPTELPPSAHTDPGNFIETSTPHGGVIVYQKQTTRDSIGRSFVTWETLGEIQPEHMDSLRGFLATRSRYQDDQGYFDKATYEEHKAQAIRQMCEDGQIQPIPTHQRTPHSGMSGGSSSKKEHTPTQAGGVNQTPQRYATAQDLRMPENTPAKSNYDPFSPPADRQPSYQQQPQYFNDPFVSPLRYDQASMIAAQMAHSGGEQTKARWQQDKGRRQQSDQTYGQRSARLHNDIQHKLGVGHFKLSGPVIDQMYFQGPPRRTVLHDPYLKQQSRGVEGHSQDGPEGTLRQNAEHPDSFTEPKPVYQSGSPSTAQVHDEPSNPQSMAPSRADNIHGQVGQLHQGSDLFSSIAPSPYNRPSSAFKRFAPSAQPPAAPTNQPSTLSNMLGQTRDIRETFDWNKTEYQLRKPFPHNQTFQPPFFIDSWPNMIDEELGIKPETASEKCDRIWSSGHQQHKENVGNALEWVRSIGKAGDEEVENAAVLMFPLRQNLGWYAEQAEAKRFGVGGLQRQARDGWEAGSPTSMTSCNYFAKHYDPLGQEQDDVRGWLEANDEARKRQLSRLDVTGSPLHPATVHFPIAFLTASTVLDFFVHFRAAPPSPLSLPLPNFLSQILSDNAITSSSSVGLTQASYTLLSLGLLTALPAIVSGGQQAILMIQKGGLYTTDPDTKQKKLREKVKTTFLHAGVNDVALALFGLKWWLMGMGRTTDYGAKGVTGMIQGDATGYSLGLREVALGLAANGIILFAANLGGALTYGMGVGLSLGGGSKKTQ
ncbi:MAG: hypothetical protein Q9159_006337 [Coniocarpon cinnabarinum]